MLTTDNLKEALRILGYQDAGGVWEKFYSHSKCKIRVDFSNKTIIYPDSIRRHERNSTFKKNENFVVLECINRLLEKGYRPEDIELEKEWTLGHIPKSGRADICIYYEDKVHNIIECKTYGNEFKKAEKQLRKDGGQLFSYWQQENSTKWLTLYAADLIDSKIVYEDPTINCTDDPNIVKLTQQEDAPDTKLYANAATAKEKFEVWENTYSKHLHHNLIFAEESAAYEIATRYICKKDLQTFTSDARREIPRQFEEILRHNNVSDKENAFNRLVALFVCKLVDEISKNDNDVVDFQYKRGSDTYEILQDRLQRLYKDGLERFIKEKIYYVSSNYPDLLFESYTGSKREQAIADLAEIIRILKFYTNNDFSFKDVHNEELFYQNGKIVVEVVQLFEKYRIFFDSRQQFLGDLFEILLCNGFKQNEGQYFTPAPITRFIWNSIPLDNFCVKKDLHNYPKVIDYACGAGHFLTEGVEAINETYLRHGLTQHNENWVGKCIYGIEKDYRLARVSKITLFMNGAGSGNIIFGEGLDNWPSQGIENETFDILTANPPYSIADFKRHLKIKNNKLALLDELGENSSEIEVLFVERINQLLKPNGYAAVLLPSSILTNESYTCARKELLKHFYIRAIVQLGAKTFAATGTNTSIFFLEKFPDMPNRTQLTLDSVRAILEGKDLSDWVDETIKKSYIRDLGIENDDYNDFIKNNHPDTVEGNNFLNAYYEDYVETTRYKLILKSRAYKKGSDKEKQRIIQRDFYKYTAAIEEEKLYFYSLTYKQKTLIVQANLSSEFLGYTWRNGQIRINKPGGMMYNPHDRTASGTFAQAIRCMYGSEIPTLTKEQGKYAKIVNTAALLDLNDSDFKAMFITHEMATIESKYTMCKLGKVCDIRIGGTPKREKTEWFNGENLWLSVTEMSGKRIITTKERITNEAVDKSSVKLIKAGTTLVSFKLTLGKVAVAGKDLYTNEAIAALVPKEQNIILDDYIYLLFISKLVDLNNYVSDKAFGKSLNSCILARKVSIPVPPLAVQHKLICATRSARDRFFEGKSSLDDFEMFVRDKIKNMRIIL